MDDDRHGKIEAACEKLIRQFAWMNDAHQHDTLADMFTLDGSFARPTDPENPIVGRERIRSFFGDRAKRQTRHIMSNTVVDVVSDDEAHARSYILLYSGDNGEQRLVGEFADVLRREGDRWLFHSRRGTLAFT